MKKLDNAINWFEIPVEDLDRAVDFYQHIFDIQLMEMDAGNGPRMALFPIADGTIGGALCQHKEFYHPGQEGPVIYLNGNPDLQNILEKVPKAGGKIIIKKRQISENHGYMAVFQDSEGNRIALQSMQ